MHRPKKFDFVHQTVFPHERVGSGDETVYDDVICALVARQNSQCAWFKVLSAGVVSKGLFISVLS